MFQKKDMIYSETMGVCRVDDITKLVNASGQGGMYYVLRAKYENNKVSYIPVEEHKVKLRELMSSDEAAMKYQSENYNKENTLECGELAYVLGMSMNDLLGADEEEE